MASYPEHDKLRAVQEQTQAIGEFLEWLGTKGIFLARYLEGHAFPREVHGFLDLLAEWSGVDLDTLEAEKRQMLADLRAPIAEPKGGPAPAAAALQVAAYRNAEQATEAGPPVPENEYGCVRCQVYHRESDGPIYAEHILWQSKHGIRRAATEG